MPEGQRPRKHGPPDEEKGELVGRVSRSGGASGDRASSPQPGSCADKPGGQHVNVPQPTSGSFANPEGAWAHGHLVGCGPQTHIYKAPGDRGISSMAVLGSKKVRREGPPVLG